MRYLSAVAVFSAMCFANISFADGIYEGTLSINGTVITSISNDNPRLAHEVARSISELIKTKIAGSRRRFTMRIASVSRSQGIFKMKTHVDVSSLKEEIQQTIDQLKRQNPRLKGFPDTLVFGRTRLFYNSRKRLVVDPGTLEIELQTDSETLARSIVNSSKVPSGFRCEGAPRLKNIVIHIDEKPKLIWIGIGLDLGFSLRDCTMTAK